MTTRFWRLLVLLAPFLAAATWLTAAQSPAQYVVVTKEGRRPLPTRSIGGQEMFAVDELAKVFGFTVREDPIAGGLTMSVRGQSIVLSPDQDIVSVGGRLVSLPAPPERERQGWFVPVDFVSRALAPVAGTRIELRKPSRLILLGDVRMPRVAARIEPAGASARITIDVVPTTAFTVTSDASRIVLRFEADALDASLPTSNVPDLVAGVRLDGTTGLAVDVGPRYASFRTSEGQQPPAGGARIVLEVLAKTTDAPAAPPGTTPPATPPPVEPPPLLDIVPPGALRTIVIDPGHGGDDGGSKGPGGNLEKQVTLSVARRLKATLEARLGVRAILTRDGDQAVGLDERAAVANNNKADLFISLHANASIRPSAVGAEVFYLSLQEYGEEAQRAAVAPRESLPVFGGGSRDIEVVPWGLAQARHIERSALFAQALERTLRERVTMSPRALQQAPFRVLVGANMPAALIELGFMTNGEQETQLMSDAHQNELVQALVAAVIQFRDGRTAPPDGPPQAPPPSGAPARPATGDRR